MMGFVMFSLALQIREQLVLIAETGCRIERGAAEMVALGAPFGRWLCPCESRSLQRRVLCERAGGPGPWTGKDII